MIGLCFEAESKCNSCGLPLPMNALVEKIVCSQCSTVNNFTVEDWKSLLEDMFEEAPNYEENEGNESTVMGGRNYQITYGRQNPKFSDTKSYIDMEDAIKKMANGKISNPLTGVEYSIRPVPESLKEACPYVTHLIGEDFSQLPNVNSDSKSPDHKLGQLVPFTCPNCAGSLQISKDSERKLKCNFCSTESFIPDEIWQKLHPTKTKSRFYFWLDENAIPFQWESYLHGIVVDSQGTIYISIEAPSSSDDELWVVALNPDLTIKWKRTSLKFKTDDNKAYLTLSANGELVLWHNSRNTILLLSTADGSEIKRVGKKTEGTYSSDTKTMDFKYCRFLAADIDGNYIAWFDRPKEKDAPSFYEFMVVDKEGNLHLPWGMEEKPKGFFSSLKKTLSNMGEGKRFSELKDKFKKCHDYDVDLSVGLDGSYYLVEHKNIAKYNRVGEQIYMIKIEEGYIGENVIGDKMGNAYYVWQYNDKSNVKKISPDGKSTTTFIENVIDGGGLCKEERLALSPNGIFYCADYGGRFRTFNMEGKLLLASSRSLEEEIEEKKEAAEKED